MTTTLVRTGPVDASPRPGRRGEARFVASEISFLVALLIGWGLLYLVVLSPFQSGHAQARLYSELRSTLAEGTAPTGSPIALGTPVALLDIPSAGVRKLVVQEGSTPDLMRDGPGHVRGTQLPGQAGLSAVMGRSLSFGAPFRHVASLRSGDQILVRTMQGRFDYRVTSVRRGGHQLPAVASGTSRLLLITAGNAGILGRFDTVYVDASLSGTAAPAGPVSEADPRGAPLAHDAGPLTLAELALALQLLVLAIGWLVWARLRWSVLAAWSTGLPVLLAALWVTSSVVSRLLPNLV